MTVAVDLEVERFRVAVVTAGGQIYHRIDERVHPYEGTDALLQRVCATVHQLLGVEGVDEPAVVVAVSGPLNPRTGVLHSPPNMLGWHDVPLKAIMEERLARAVLVGNTANLAALGEHRFGAGRGSSDLVYIAVGTDIGGGIITNNELLLGTDGLAGGIGHMTIVPEGPRCACGNYGCLEALSSRSAIARRSIELIEGGAKSTLIEAAGGDVRSINAEMVEQAVLTGDALASTVVREAAEFLAIGVSNVVHLLNPQMVIIGGSLSRIGAPLLQPVWDVVARRTMIAFRQHLQIVTASLGDDATLLGCMVLDSLNVASTLPSKVAHG